MDRALPAEKHLAMKRNIQSCRHLVFVLATSENALHENEVTACNGNDSRIVDEDPASS
jgi:hypothetical protein